MPLRNSIALVTGAAGFVGANLVRRLLAEGARVHVAVRSTTDRWRLSQILDIIDVHVCDLSDSREVQRTVDAAAPDVVFHLARHRGNPATLEYRAAYTHNVTATLNLLEAVKARPIRRFVHAGSSLEYNFAHSPLRESQATSPTTVHGVTKAAASMLCQQFAQAHGVPAVVLRLFTVYGPWEGPARFVPQLMMAALEGQPVRVTHAPVVHDWIHVDDVVDACVRAAVTDRIGGEIFNVATGRESSNEQVMCLVQELSGRVIARASEPYPERSWDTTRWVADISKARDRLNWSAATDLRTGLSNTIEWFREHAALYRSRCA